MKRLNYDDLASLYYYLQLFFRTNEKKHIYLEYCYWDSYCPLDLLAVAIRTMKTTTL